MESNKKSSSFLLKGFNIEFKLPIGFELKSDEKMCFYCGKILKKSNFSKHEKTEKHKVLKETKLKELFSEVENKEQKRIDKEIKKSLNTKI